jgi:hypothetical protein
MSTLETAGPLPGTYPNGTAHHGPDAAPGDGAAGATRFASFEEFWPYYLGEHRHPLNRALHFIGTSGALLTAASSLVLGPAVLPLALVAGYGPAWIGHFFVEKNRPATFQYPLWSLRGDFRMYGMMWTGRITDELRAHGIV